MQNLIIERSAKSGFLALGVVALLIGIGVAATILIIQPHVNGSATADIIVGVCVAIVAAGMASAILIRRLRERDKTINSLINERDLAQERAIQNKKLSDEAWDELNAAEVAWEKRKEEIGELEETARELDGRVIKLSMECKEMAEKHQALSNMYEMCLAERNEAMKDAIKTNQKNAELSDQNLAFQNQLHAYMLTIEGYERQLGILPPNKLQESMNITPRKMCVDTFKQGQPATDSAAEGR